MDEDEWYDEDNEEEESEGMMLAFNPKTGELEEFKEEDYISVPKKDLDVIKAFLEANQEAIQRTRTKGKVKDYEACF